MTQTLKRPAIAVIAALSDLPAPEGSPLGGPVGVSPRFWCDSEKPDDG